MPSTNLTNQIKGEEYADHFFVKTPFSRIQADTFLIRRIESFSRKKLMGFFRILRTDISKEFMNFSI